MLDFNAFGGLFDVFYVFKRTFFRLNHLFKKNKKLKNIII